MRQQFGVRAAFDDLSAIHHQDQVRGQDGAQAMRDHDAGASRHDALQRILDQRFGFAVERAGGFVEHQDARVFQDDARQGNALFLAAAQAIAALAHDGVVALRQVHDELVDVGGARRGFHFILRASGRA
jgi:hypothetical protein